MATAVAPVVDVGDRDFETQVIERSRTTPVVVDFWATWCGPCRVLGPVLERLAREMQGQFVLAKVDVDQNPALSRRFGVQSIPMVKGFQGGQAVDGFTGALPESQVRAWLRKLVPAGVDQIAEEAAALGATNPAKAIERYRAALKGDPKHETSLIGLGRLLVLTGDGEAQELLRAVPATSKRHGEAQALIGLAEFLGAPTPRGRHADPQHDPRYAAAAAAARSHDWEGALQQLLEIVQRDGVANEGGAGDRARRAMISLFSLLGDADPLVPRYRRLLANALF